MGKALLQDQQIQSLNYPNQALYLSRAFEIIKDNDLKSKFQILTSSYYQCQSCGEGTKSKNFNSIFSMEHWKIDHYLDREHPLTSLNCRCRGMLIIYPVIIEFPDILIVEYERNQSTIKYVIKFKFNEIPTRSTYLLFSYVCYKPKSGSCKLLISVLTDHFYFKYLSLDSSIKIFPSESVSPTV